LLAPLLPANQAEKQRIYQQAEKNNLKSDFQTDGQKAR
jgi:hypothetical protein